jgi:hypothetical protein
MILARLTLAIRQQNWFAVVLEFVIVVAGVVIGLQVTEWNKARQDRSDEAAFLARLHLDIELAENLSERVRERRLQRMGDIAEVIDILFGRSDADALTDTQCGALTASHYYDIYTADLAAFTELASAGRVGIIRDADLRRALVEYGQIRSRLDQLITLLSAEGIALPQRFPDLISVSAQNDAQVNEIRNQSSCDLDGMRANRSFLNATSANADAYDAYIRDGLRPWSDQLTQLHHRIDLILDIDHDNGVSP